MAKKKLNIAAMQNELSGGKSAFFPGYEQGKRPATEPAVTYERPPDRATSRPVDRPTGRRVPVRRGFEFYEDQLSRLKKMSLQEQMEGKPGNMSQMVREALDQYFKKHG
jgi:hypothetical protein